MASTNTIAHWAGPELVFTWGVGGEGQRINWLATSPSLHNGRSTIAAGSRKQLFPVTKPTYCRMAKTSGCQEFGIDASGCAGVRSTLLGRKNSKSLWVYKNALMYRVRLRRGNMILFERHQDTWSAFTFCINPASLDIDVTFPTLNLLDASPLFTA